MPLTVAAYKDKRKREKKKKKRIETRLLANPDQRRFASTKPILLIKSRSGRRKGREKRKKKKNRSMKGFHACFHQNNLRSSLSLDVC